MYIKKYNEFLKEGLFDRFKKKEEEPKNWQEKFDKIYNYFISIKIKPSKKYHFFDININNDYFSVSFDKIHLLFSKRNNEYVIIDMQDKTEYIIDELLYNEYFKKSKEMSDFLDDKSEKEINKSSTTISDNGIKLGFDEGDLAIDELNYKIQDEFDSFLDKEYEFELKYNLWDSKNSNEEIIERKLLKITNIKINFGGSRFYAELETKGILNEYCNIWLEGKKYEYTDLSVFPVKFKNIIMMNVTKEKLTRKNEREKEDKYPSIISYTITPSKYNTIEFINNVTSLLEELNNNIKKSHS